MATKSKQTSEKKNTSTKGKSNSKKSTDKVKNDPVPKKEVKQVIEKIPLSAEVKNLLKLVLWIVIILIPIFVITYALTRTEREVPLPDEEIRIQYDEILLSRLLVQGESEYHVLVYDQDDNFLPLYMTIIQGYKMEDDSSAIFIASMNEGLNRMFIAEESNTHVTDINDLRISEVTLFRIRNNRIVSVHEGREAVIAALEALTK